MTSATPDNTPTQVATARSPTTCERVRGTETEAP